MMLSRPFLFFLFACFGSLNLRAQSDLLGVPDLFVLPIEAPTASLSYGTDSLQFGELRLPPGEGPFPVIAIIHGGCWLAGYDLHLMDAMATDLTKRGYATWNLEYRRVGDIEGGWPNTFLDIGRGIDHLRQLNEEYPIELSHIVVAGHSAGGHLALWTASRAKIPAESPLFIPNPLPISGVVSLAGITDLEQYLVRNEGSCGSAVDELMGGLPENLPERYQIGSPIAILPIGMPQILITGKEDPIVPLTHVAPYASAAKAKGDKVKMRRVAKAGHFEVIAPGSNAWPTVVKAIRKMAKRKVVK